MHSALIGLLSLTEVVLVLALISPGFVHVGRYDVAWAKWHEDPTEENRKAMEAGRDELMAVEMKIKLAVSGLLLANSLALARIAKARRAAVLPKACVLLVTSMLVAGCGAAGPGPDDIVIENPSEFVRVSRALVEEKQANPTRYADSISDAQLPESLRIKRITVGWPMNSVRYAVVESDHVDLVLVLHPDGLAGARVWAPGADAHSDKATRYPDIYFFICGSDDPPNTVC